jgi:hypothetical protein
MWRCLVGSEAAAGEACIARAAPVLVAVMQRHRHRRPVQRLGVALLVTLTELNDGNRHAACTAGAVNAVLFALTEHSRSEDIVARGCRFMLLLSPMNILSSGVDLAGLSRVATLRRSRHSHSALVQRSTRDLLQAIALVPSDVSLVVDTPPSPALMSASELRAYGRDEEGVPGSGCDRSLGSGVGCAPMTSSGRLRRRAGGASGRLGKLQPSRRSSSFMDGKVPAFGTTVHNRPGAGGFDTAGRPLGPSLVSRMMSRFRSRGSREETGSKRSHLLEPPLEAVRSAIGGESARWAKPQGSTTGGSGMLRSSLGSGRSLGISLRRRASSSGRPYASPTQYVAMRPLVATLRDSRERAAAAAAPGGEEGGGGEDDDFSILQDAGDLSEMSSSGCGSSARGYSGLSGAGPPPPPGLSIGSYGGGPRGGTGVGSSSSGGLPRGGHRLTHHHKKRSQRQQQQQQLLQQQQLQQLQQLQQIPDQNLLRRLPSPDDNSMGSLSEDDRMLGRLAQQSMHTTPPQSPASSAVSSPVLRPAAVAESNQLSPMSPGKDAATKQPPIGAVMLPVPSPIVGSSMSSAGVSHRPESSLRLRGDRVTSVGSGRRGESGSLSREGGSGRPVSDPLCGASRLSPLPFGVDYGELDH